MEFIISMAKQFITLFGSLYLYMKIFANQKSCANSFLQIFCVSLFTAALITAGKQFASLNINLLALSIYILLAGVLAIGQRQKFQYVVTRLVTIYLIFQAIGIPSYILGHMITFFVLQKQDVLTSGFAGVISYALVTILLLLIPYSKIINIYIKQSRDKRTSIFSGVLFAAFFCVYCITGAFHNFQAKHLNVVVYLALLLSSVAVICWVIDYLRRRYVLRLKEQEVQKKAAEAARFEKDALAAHQKLHDYNRVVSTLEQEMRSLQQEGSDEKKLSLLSESLSAVIASQQKDALDANLELLPVWATDIALVDLMLNKHFRVLAQKERILFDGFIGGSLKPLLEKKLLTDFELNRLLENLLSNAFRAVMNNDPPLKKVLLMVPRRRDNLISFFVCDNGVDFTPAAKTRFGEAGFSEFREIGGTGYGLSNMLKVLRSCASGITLTEMDLEESGYSKKLEITFGSGFFVNINSERTAAVH